MVLEFPILADYAVFPAADRLIYATHGHHYMNQLPPPAGRHSSTATRTFRRGNRSGMEICT